MMVRPTRQAGLVCKRKMREQLQPARRTRATHKTSPPPSPSAPPFRPTVVNECDAITLEEVDWSAPTTFLARTDCAGTTFRAYHAPGLFRSCVESVAEPHDPVTMRPFDGAEIVAIELAAGEKPGTLFQRRLEASRAREQDRSGGDLASTDNQEAMLGVLIETMAEAADDACAADIENVMAVAVGFTTEFRPTVRSILNVLEVGHQTLELIKDKIDEAFAKAARLADTRPQAAALVMVMGDTVMETVRDRVNQQVARARTAPLP